MRTDSLSLWGGDLRVQNFELRTDELARVPWSKEGPFCFLIKWWCGKSWICYWMTPKKWTEFQGLLYVLNSWRAWFFCGCLGSKFVHLCLKMLELENFRKPFRIVVEVCNHRVALLHHMILRIKRNYRMVPFKMLFILIFRIWLPIYINFNPNPPSLSVNFPIFPPGPWHRCQWHGLASHTWLRAGVARGVGARYPVESMGNYVPDSGPRNNEQIILNMKHGKITTKCNHQRWSQTTWITWARSISAIGEVVPWNAIRSQSLRIEAGVDDLYTTFL